MYIKIGESILWFHPARKRAVPPTLEMVGGSTTTPSVVVAAVAVVVLVVVVVVVIVCYSSSCSCSWSSSGSSSSSHTMVGVGGSYATQTNQLQCSDASGQTPELWKFRGRETPPKKNGVSRSSKMFTEGTARANFTVLLKRMFQQDVGKPRAALIEPGWHSKQFHGMPWKPS